MVEIAQVFGVDYTHTRKGHVLWLTKDRTGRETQCGQLFVSSTFTWSEMFLVIHFLQRSTLSAQKASDCGTQIKGQLYLHSRLLLTVASHNTTMVHS